MTDHRRELTQTQIDELRDHATTLATNARRIIHDALRDGFDVKLKSDGTFVTDTDIAVEKKLRALVAARYPEHGIIGEEFPPTRPEAAFQWVFDPIDGTEDYVNRVPTYGSIIGLYYRGEPVVGAIDHPSLDLRCDA